MYKKVEEITQTGSSQFLCALRGGHIVKFHQFRQGGMKKLEHSMLLSQKFRIASFAYRREPIQSSTRCARVLFQKEWIKGKSKERMIPKYLCYMLLDVQLIVCTYRE
jgi:hypothetical protein